MAYALRKSGSKPNWADMSTQRYGQDVVIVK
jgi:hypothetical protein